MVFMSSKKKVMSGRAFDEAEMVSQTKIVSWSNDRRTNEVIEEMFLGHNYGALEEYQNGSTEDHNEGISKMGHKILSPFHVMIFHLDLGLRKPLQVIQPRW